MLEKKLLMMLNKSVAQSKYNNRIVCPCHQMNAGEETLTVLNKLVMCV
jgi:hypothetical protein